ncbi:hypothetical protein [Blastococcus sp. SYSU DS1024]
MSAAAVRTSAFRRLCKELLVERHEGVECDRRLAGACWCVFLARRPRTVGAVRLGDVGQPPGLGREPVYLLRVASNAE